jgi:hypothetical protein
MNPRPVEWLGLLAQRPNYGGWTCLTSCFRVIVLFDSGGCLSWENCRPGFHVQIDW